MFQRYILLSTLIAIVISVGAVSILATSVYAQEQKFSASLSGSQEVPPNTSTAKGWAWLKPMGDTVWYKVNATGIDKVTMAHIHNAKAGENGDPIAMLQIAKSSGPTLAQGNITGSDLMGSLAGKSITDLVAKMQSGETYVNVHTNANPNGEIRGQIEMANATMMSNSTMTAK
jgi:Ca2+/Na+ antiporter